MSAEQCVNSQLRHAAGKNWFVLFAAGLLLVSAGCGGGTSQSPLTQNGATSAATQVFPSNPPNGTTPLEVRVGDNPFSSEGQIVAFQLKVNSIKAENTSGTAWIELLGPGSVELTHTASSTAPIAAGSAPSGTYNQLVVDYSGARVTYLDGTSALPATADLTLPTNPQTISLASPIVITTSPSIVNINVDVAQTVKLTGVGAPSMVMPVITVSQIAVASANQQPETGQIQHVAGKVSSVDTIGNTLTLTLGLPNSALVFSTSGAVLENLSLANAVNQLVDITGSTQTDGTLLASHVSSIDSGAAGVSGSEIEGVLAGFNPSGTTYVVAQDTNGANDANDPSKTTALVGQKVSVDLSAADFSADTDNIDMTGITAVFDGSHLFPGQQVEIESFDALALSDPDGNAALISPWMVRLQPQTISGTVANYTAGTGTATFDLVLPADGTSYLKVLNPTATVHVYQQAGTNLDVLSAIGNGQTVQVRGLLFCNDLSDALQQGTNFVIVAGRVAKGN
jgi:hypothetical protein